MSQLLRREANKGFTEVTGEQSIDEILEIPCIYRLYGHRVYEYKMKELVDSQTPKHSLADLNGIRD